jgi:tetratricopeptide (TPR) repeat protein
MGSLLSNMGVVAEYAGDYDASHDFHERALALRRNLGDRWAIAVSQTNLGMIAVLREDFEEARAAFEEAMRLNREVGDAWMVAISHNNLGNANRGLGDYEAAREQYLDSLLAYRAYEDKWATAFLLEDVGVLAAMVDEQRTALTLVGAAGRMREEIGSPRGPALEADLDARLAVARAIVGDEAAEIIRAAGAELTFAESLERGVAFCAKTA